jgi:hypothetical protein
MRRWVPAILAAGVVATAALHVWLGLAWCCAAPRPPGPRFPSWPCTSSEHGLTFSRSTPGTSTATLAASNAISQQGGRRHRVVGDWAGQALRASQAEGRLSLPGRLRGSVALLAGAASRLPLEAPASGASRRRGEVRASDMPAFVWAAPGSLTVIGTHLHRPSRDPWLHALQVSALTHLVRQHRWSAGPRRRLNTSPWSNAFRSCAPPPGSLPRASDPTRRPGRWPAAGARSHLGLARACGGRRRHGAGRRRRPPAGLGANRMASGYAGARTRSAAQAHLTPCSGAPASRRRAPG